MNNRIVKFRFFIKDKNPRTILSKLLTTVNSKYSPPSLYYIKQLDDIRLCIDSLDQIDVLKLLEKKKNKFPDLLQEMNQLIPYWDDLPKDLKSYLLICFEIEYEDIVKFSL